MVYDEITHRKKIPIKITVRAKYFCSIFIFLYIKKKISLSVYSSRLLVAADVKI